MKKFLNNTLNVALTLTALALVITSFSMLPIVIINWHIFTDLWVKIFALSTSVIGLAAGINCIYDFVQTRKAERRKHYETH